ncbi:MAG: UDP-glucose/GDP-mannose dehydrogenase family protein [Gemmatimonadota bacterium]|nr:MAG: UDP-glucose/GDP-mannose dehydrogenase family protein [Gemmatimonadota bacterium]
MNVAVIGTGYVGLVAGACFAEAGNDVVCADVDESKISRLRQSDIPIYEPGLESLVQKNQEEGRLRFTSDVGAAIESASVVFIAVGTPPDEDGSADLQHVLNVAQMIGKHMNGPKIVATKSTVPVGTAEQVRRTIAQQTSTEFHVCSNPEFLKEGAAVDDFMKPDRVIVGADSEEAAATLQELYAPFVRTGNPLILMDVTSAELSKYAANAMLATRISFMNQIAELCERVGADVNLVRRGIGSDPRIGKHFLFPGPGYGGSCFPKDVRALAKTADECGVSLDVIRAVQDANERQKGVLFRKLQSVLGETLANKTIAVWGLAFKAQTDDMRESPSIQLIKSLLKAGARVRAHDPKARETARRMFGDQIEFVGNAYEAVSGADALVIVTEWMEFRNPDFERMKSLLKQPIIVDGRNLYDPARMLQRGFTYVCIGRRTVQ